MSIVPLVSGGLDSTVMSVLIKQEGIEQHPVFINYGQINFQREYAACRRTFHKLRLPTARMVAISGWGRTISSGLTDKKKRIFEDAFLPGRNLMFLLVAASYAYKKGATSIAIGLLDESKSIFPDQTREFCDKAENVLSHVLERQIRVKTPLISLGKSEVVSIARKLGIKGTYSCHAGTVKPCGICIACREYSGIEV